MLADGGAPAVPALILALPVYADACAPAVHAICLASAMRTWQTRLPPTTVHALIIASTMRAFFPGVPTVPALPLPRLAVALVLATMATPW